jgi:hypothetical protein
MEIFRLTLWFGGESHGRRCFPNTHMQSEALSFYIHTSQAASKQASSVRHPERPESLSRMKRWHEIQQHAELFRKLSRMRTSASTVSALTYPKTINVYFMKLEPKSLHRSLPANQNLRTDHKHSNSPESRATRSPIPNNVPRQPAGTHVSVSMQGYHVPERPVCVDSGTYMSVQPLMSGLHRRSVAGPDFV